MNRTIAPSVTHDYIFDLIQPVQSILSNGVEVYYIEGGKQDVCRIDVLYKAGNIFEHKNLLASSANDLLGEGTRLHSAHEMNEAFDFYGAYLQRESSRDYSGISLFASDQHLPALLPLLMEVITDAVYPENEWEVYIKNRRLRFEDSLKKVDFVCRNEFTGYLYGDHPYGKPVRMHNFDEVNLDDIRSFYHQWYAAQLPVIFVTGRVGDASRALIESHFSSLTGTRQTFPDKKFNGVNTHKNFIALPGAIQSAIRIGRTMVMIDHPDYPALSVTNTILGGYFGSRLMKNIREEKGLTYGIGSGLVSFEKNGMWVIAAEVAGESATLAVNEIYHEIEKLIHEPVSSEELTVVKNYIMGNFIKSIDGPFAQSEKIKTMVLRQLPQDFYQQQMSAMMQITSEDIMRISGSYFAPNLLTELVAGKS